jgi:2-polyprenyl-3-methyl-5-hydroxy-6-metoxy-1,4-benzoquinol methylase
MKRPVFNDAWTEEVKRVYEHDMCEMWDPFLSRHVYNMYQCQLEMYKKLVPAGAKDVLDVGCAQATLALQLAEAGYAVTAVDIRQGFLDYAQTRWTHGDINFITGNVFEVNFAKKFDVIFANQILEHLVYPAEFVQKLALFLRPGGKMVMTTPNWAYIKNALPSYSELGDPSQWEDHQYTADGDGHFFAYTAEELLAIFRQAGLSEVQCTPYETPWISGHLKFRYLHSVAPYSMLKALDQVAKSMPLRMKICYQLLVSGKI